MRWLDGYFPFVFLLVPLCISIQLNPFWSQTKQEENDVELSRFSYWKMKKRRILYVLENMTKYKICTQINKKGRHLYVQSKVSALEKINRIRRKKWIIFYIFWAKYTSSFTASSVSNAGLCNKKQIQHHYYNSNHIEWASVCNNAVFPIFFFGTSKLQKHSTVFYFY